MAFKIHAEVIDPATGMREIGTETLNDTVETKEEALLAMSNLKAQGLSVVVTGPDGRPVSEEED